MKLPWTQEAEELLLGLVRGHQCVWDPKHDHYHNSKKRREVFSKIADVMKEQIPALHQLTADHVQIKFKNVRTYFLRLYREVQKAPIGSATQTAQKWPLYDVCLFLADSVLDTSDTTSSCDDGSSEASSPRSEGHGSAAEAVTSYRPIHTPSRGVQVKQEATGKMKRPSSDEANLDLCIDTLCGYIKKKSTSVEASSMGSLVESTMEKLPYAKQIWFMQKLVQLIAEVNDLATENVAAENV